MGEKLRPTLPQIVAEDMEDFVIEVYRQDTMKLVYTLTIKDRQFKPQVFASAAHKIRVGDPDQEL